MPAEDKPLLSAMSEEQQADALALQEELKRLGCYHPAVFNHALTQHEWPQDEAKGLSGYSSPSNTKLLFTAFSAIVAIALVYAETESLLGPGRGPLAGNTDAVKSHVVREFMLISQLAGLQAEKTGGYAIDAKSSLSKTETQFSLKIKKIGNLFLNVIYFWYLLVKLEYKLAKMLYYHNGPELQQIFNFGVEEFIQSMTEITCILGMVMSAWKAKKAYAELKKHESSLQILLEKKEALLGDNASEYQISMIDSMIEKEVALFKQAEKDVIRYGLALLLFTALFVATFYVFAPTIVMLTTILYLLTLSQDVSSRLTAFATLHSDHAIAPIFSVVGKFLYHISGLSLLQTVKNLMFGSSTTLFAAKESLCHGPRASRSFENRVGALCSGGEDIEARIDADMTDAPRITLK